jgi:hypothetical protein
MGCYSPPPLKDILSRDLRMERGSNEIENWYDECLHGKIDGKDKWEDMGKALWNLDISIGKSYQL